MTHAEKAMQAFETAQKSLDKAMAKLPRMQKKLEKLLNDADAGDWEIKWAKSDIEEAERGIEKAKQNLARKRVALEIAKKKDNEFDELPASVKKMVEFVKEMSFKSLMNYRQYLRDLRDNNFNEWFTGTLSSREFTNKTESEIREMADRDGTEFALDLVRRTKEIVGEVTDWSNLTFAVDCLNGYVIGTDGAAEVFTIRAGGYNIQRAHYRTLVKPRKIVK